MRGSGVLLPLLMIAVGVLVILAAVATLSVQVAVALGGLAVVGAGVLLLPTEGAR